MNRVARPWKRRRLNGEVTPHETTKDLPCLPRAVFSLSSILPMTKDLFKSGVLTCVGPTLDEERQRSNEVYVSEQRQGECRL